MDEFSLPIPLGPNLWIDLPHYLIIRAEEEIALDRREAKLLEVLLRNLRLYIALERLASRIMSPVGYESTLDYRHCLHETVRCVRQKLGDSAHTILRNKRGVGYGIFPQNLTHP